MAELSCKHCGSGTFVRNGMANGRTDTDRGLEPALQRGVPSLGPRLQATDAGGGPPAASAGQSDRSLQASQILLLSHEYARHIGSLYHCF